MTSEVDRKKIVPARDSGVAFRRARHYITDETIRAIQGQRRYQVVCDDGSHDPVVIEEMSRYGRQFFSLPGAELVLVAGPFEVGFSFESPDANQPTWAWVTCETCRWAHPESRTWRSRKTLLKDALAHTCDPLT